MGLDRADQHSMTVGAWSLLPTSASLIHGIGLQNDTLRLFPVDL
jgi:hypothetical protein